MFIPSEMDQEADSRKLNWRKITSKIFRENNYTKIENREGLFHTKSTFPVKRESFFYAK